MVKSLGVRAGTFFGKRVFSKSHFFTGNINFNDFFFESKKTLTPYVNKKKDGETEVMTVLPPDAGLVQLLGFLLPCTK